MSLFPSFALHCALTPSPWTNVTQESERRVRQRDTEIERLKTKLEAFSCKERANAARLREALSSWKSGAVLTTAMGSGAGSGPGSGSIAVASPNNRSMSSASFSSPAGKRPVQTSPSRRRDSTASVTPLRRESSMSFRRESLTPGSKIRRDKERDISRESGKQLPTSEEASAWDVIEALDAQKNILERRNEELTEQLLEHSRNMTGECRSLWGRDRDRDREDTHSSSYLGSKSDIFSDLDEGGMESILENKNVGSPRSTVRPPPAQMTTPTAVKMYEHISEQQKRIEALQSSCEKERNKGEEGEKLCNQLRSRIQESQQVRLIHSNL